MSVSIITPTYMDGESIQETFESILMQTYTDWEWIIINDGSTDNTGKVVRSLAAGHQKCKIIYIEQENRDQLNAIINGLGYAAGEFIFILHSDDLLPSEDFLSKCVSYMKEHPKCDVLQGDYDIINDKSSVVDKFNMPEYKKTDATLALTLLWLGRNAYGDVGFYRKNIYEQSIRYMYLTWNMPFWITENNHKLGVLNMEKVDFPILKYRIHEGNYINSDLGVNNVLNGELRTAIKLMTYYDIPAYRFQYFMYRVFNKLKWNYKVFFYQRESRHKAEIIKYIIQKRIDFKKASSYFQAIYGFYKHKSDREIRIAKLPKDLPLFYGKDVRAFNKLLFEASLPEVYTYILNEMKIGFSKIIVENEEDKNRMRIIIKFMCIEQVQIVVAN